MTYYITETTEYGTKIKTSDDPIIALHYILVNTKDRLLEIDDYLFRNVNWHKQDLTNLISLCTRIHKVEDMSEFMRDYLGQDPNTLKEGLKELMTKPGSFMIDEKAGYHIDYGVDKNGHYVFQSKFETNLINYQCQLTHQDDLEVLSELFI